MPIDHRTLRPRRGIVAAVVAAIKSLWAAEAFDATWHWSE